MKITKEMFQARKEAAKKANGVKPIISEPLVRSYFNSFRQSSTMTAWFGRSIHKRMAKDNTWLHTKYAMC